MSEVRIKWACPMCGAKAHAHGKGECASRFSCDGFVCECDDRTSENHGESFADPCPAARCYHCDWEGTFPKKPKGLQAWERRALDAGWAPPKKRAAEIGMSVTKKGGT